MRSVVAEALGSARAAARGAVAAATARRPTRLIVTPIATGAALVAASVGASRRITARNEGAVSARNRALQPRAGTVLTLIAVAPTLTVRGARAARTGGIAAPITVRRVARRRWTCALSAFAPLPCGSAVRAGHAAHAASITGIAPSADTSCITATRAAHAGALRRLSSALPALAVESKLGAVGADRAADAACDDLVAAQARSGRGVAAAVAGAGTTRGSATCSRIARVARIPGVAPLPPNAAAGVPALGSATSPRGTARHRSTARSHARGARDPTQAAARRTRTPAGGVLVFQVTTPEAASKQPDGGSACPQHPARHSGLVYIKRRHSSATLAAQQRGQVSDAGTFGRGTAGRLGPRPGAPTPSRFADLT